MNIVMQQEFSESMLVLRYPETSDVKVMCDYVNALSKEQTFVRLQGQEVSLDEETVYLETQLHNIQKKKTVLLLAFLGDELVGISSIEQKSLVEVPEGVLSVSVAKNYRGKGLGKILITKTIEEAITQLKGLKVLTLGVFETNDAAKNVYNQLGFKEYGRIPKGILYKDEYIDHIYMYKEVHKE